MTELTHEEQALAWAGQMAEHSLALVGGMGLNGVIHPVHPDRFSDLAKKLRHAAEQYNSHIIAIHKSRNE
jgi:hypothetical protein